MTSQRFAATITVQYVNAPRPGQFSGSIKDAQGNYWGIPGHATHLFQPGQTYEVMYWQKQTQSGKVFNNIASVNGQELSDKAQQQPTPQPQPQPRPQPTPSQPQKEDPEKVRNMFIMGVVGRAMGSGKYDATDIKALTLAAAHAWSEHHKPWPGPNPDEMGGLEGQEPPPYEYGS